MYQSDTRLVLMDAPIAVAQQLAAEVRAAMSSRNISQRDLAARTGVPLVTLNRRLTGQGKPFDIAELVAIAEVLDLSLVELTIRAERALTRAAA